MKKRILTALAILFVTVFSAEPTTLRVLSYNLRFGQYASMGRFADYISAFDPDLVALQECDWATSRELAPAQNGIKFINVLAEKTGLFGIFGKAINYKGGYYGVGLLSRYPILRYERVLLPNPECAEQRVILVADVELPSGEVITFVSTHLDFSSSENRKKQAEFIVKYFADSPQTVILAGDMNATPQSPEIQIFINAGWQQMTDTEYTFSSVSPFVKIDYIFCRSARKADVLSTKVCNDVKISDHFAVFSIIDINK